MIKVTCMPIDCFSIPAIDPKCLVSQFFSCRIRIYIAILTGAQNGHRSRLKDSAFFLKNVHDKAEILAFCLSKLY